MKVHCIALGTFPNQLKLFQFTSLDLLWIFKIIVLYPFFCLSQKYLNVIRNTLVSFLERNSLIIPTQIGFRQNHSAIHSILDTITECYQNVEGKRFSVLIFLDVKNVFDFVCH